MLTAESLSIRPVRVVYACPIICKHDVIHKTGNTEFVALLSEQDRAVRATCICNTYRKFGAKLRHVVFEIR